MASEAEYQEYVETLSDVKADRESCPLSLTKYIDHWLLATPLSATPTYRDPFPHDRSR